MSNELPKTYDPKASEDAIYAMWEAGGYFHADAGSDKPPFTIVIPPPNVTGQLHMGHALDNTVQDILIRYKRMQGFEALWLPGTDHAGIATQIKVEETLRGEGLTRFDLGREAFLARVWEWKEKYGSTIINQLKKLGSSCDWSRERFTMDEGCSKAVREVFVTMYEKGLIYKGSRIINWCPSCTTALSDAEVEHEERNGFFWYIKYPVKGSDEFVVIATTRPETMLGDTAVAVNPEDGRYTHLIGKTLILPLTEREIPIIADEYVDKDFGTGCVKITPCHDPNDFDVGMRHGLEQVLVMDEHAKINANGGKYNGMNRYAARKAIVADLEALGLLVKTEPHAHSVGQCYRCDTTVEPITSAQWFVKMAPLAGEAIAVVRDGRIKFEPERFGKIYLNWMENVHDWCISRQLWWGHRIPAFYCGDCGQVSVSREDLTFCPSCGGAVTQDEDVLDTWFSSALWPFSTLGWPEDTEDLRRFYPTSVLVTAYDIIFFWVARMIFQGMEFMDKEPFATVFIHGLVRDAEGRKMSKSLGNGIDPLDIIGRYGADALRFALIGGVGPGNDTRFSEDKAEAARNFANKIWNASRFALLNLTISENILPTALETEDKWILTKLDRLIKQVGENLDSYEPGMAAQKLYDFLWDDLCDWYIELIKPRLSDLQDEGAQRVLCYVLTVTLKLLHPFMPFITEFIYQSLPGADGSIMIADWPKAAGYDYMDEERDIEMVMALIRGVRNRRAEMNVPASKRPKLHIITEQPGVFTRGEKFIKKLAYAGEIEVTDEAGFTGDAAQMAAVLCDRARVLMPLAELVDMEKEKARLEKEKAGILKEIAMAEGKLANEGFVSRAPQSVVDAERDKLAKYRAELENTEKALAQL